MRHRSPDRRRSGSGRRGSRSAFALLLLAICALAVPGTAQSAGAGTAGAAAAGAPTVVLVHGAFADASGWAAVTERLQKRGYDVLAPANPLRGLSTDALSLRSFLATVPGPIVLVGHSYGGAVITEAATGNPNVKGLVYIAAFALDAGETVATAIALGGGKTDLLNHLVLRPEAGSGGANVDGYIAPAAFPALFAADLPAPQAKVLASAQRPAALTALVEPAGVPAWMTIKSWYLVARQDKTIPPEAERVMAKRAKSTVVEIDSSHVAMMSHPDQVFDLIEDAAAAS